MSKPEHASTSTPTISMAVLSPCLSPLSIRNEETLGTSLPWNWKVCNRASNDLDKPRHGAAIESLNTL
jgi:hypothetical protein